MIALIRFLLAILTSPLKSKSRLEAENAALRQQLIVLRRKTKGRARLTNADRCFFIELYRWLCHVVERKTRMISLTILFMLQQWPNAMCPWPSLEKLGASLLK